MASPAKVATKQNKADHVHAKKTGGADASKPLSFKKINPPELPVIDINCGGNLSHIKNSQVVYCQKELGPISRIFTEGQYQAEIVIHYDESSLTKENDPLGIKLARIIAKMKQADSDNDAYEKSKGKLYGIISSMTTKEVDEKLSIHKSHHTSGTPTATA